MKQGMNAYTTTDGFPMQHVDAPDTYKTHVLFYRGDVVEYTDHGGSRLTAIVLHGSNAGFNGLIYDVRTLDEEIISSVSCDKLKLIERTTSTSAIPHSNGWNPQTGRKDR